MTFAGIPTLFVAAFALVATHALAQNVKPIQGDVVRLTGHDLQVKASDGQVVDVALADDAHVSVLGPSSLAAIKSGEFIGATAKPGNNGMLVASKVYIFPESMRGTDEGHRPMKANPGSTMTNATVASVSRTARGRAPSSMTNATVAKVGSVSGERLLHLTYQGGSQNILVPANIPVVTYERGSLASLTPGAHVVVYVTQSPDGKLAASRVGVGKNGSVPPI